MLAATPPVNRKNQPPRGQAGWWIGLAIGASLAVSGAVLFATTLPREIAFMAGIFVLAALLWMTEAIPLFATGLLVIALEILLLANPSGWAGLGFAASPSPPWREILQAAADPLLLLFLGGFILAAGLAREGVDRALSAWLLQPFGRQPRWLLLGLMLVTAVFSMWMSNTATTVMMLAVAASLLKEVPAGDPFRKGLMLGVPIAANIGGMGTPIASPPNAIAMGLLEKQGTAIGFGAWMLLAVPLMIVLLAFAWFLLVRCFPAKAHTLTPTRSAAPLTTRGRAVLAIGLVTVLLWMTASLHGVPAEVVALLPVVLLTASGLFGRSDWGGLEWNALVIIAGAVCLGAGIRLTGLDRLLVQALPGSDGNGFALLATLVVATLVLGTFMSNTAIASLLLPIGLSAKSVGAADGISAAHIALAVAFAASMSMALPISTPPNTLAAASGEFTSCDLAKVAVPIGLVAAGLILLGSGPLLRLLGIR